MKPIKLLLLFIENTSFAVWFLFKGIALVMENTDFDRVSFAYKTVGVISSSLFFGGDKVIYGGAF